LRVFLDTNVLISAVATRGLCADVLREVLAQHELVTSDLVLDEVAEILQERLGVAPGDTAEYVRLLKESAFIARPEPVTGLELTDKDDLPILGAAVASGARFFVTGDNELLRLATVGGLTILSPRAFHEKRTGP